MRANVAAAGAPDRDGLTHRAYSIVYTLIVIRTIFDDRSDLIFAGA